MTLHMCMSFVKVFTSSITS